MDVVIVGVHDMCVLYVFRMSQQFYMQVSAWMIHMKADLVTVSSKTRLNKEILKKEISVRVNQILQVSGLIMCTSFYCQLYSVA